MLTIPPVGSEALMRLITRRLITCQPQLHAGITWEDKKRKHLGQKEHLGVAGTLGTSEAPQVILMRGRD